MPAFPIHDHTHSEAEAEAEEAIHAAYPGPSSISPFGITDWQLNYQHQHHHHQQQQQQDQQEQEQKQQQRQRDEDTAKFIDSLFATPSPPHPEAEKSVVSGSPPTAHGETSRSPALNSPSTSTVSPASQQRRGTKRKSGEDEVGQRREALSEDKGQGAKPIARRKRQRRLHEVTWNLDEKAQEEYEVANRLFQACLLDSDINGRCRFRPSESLGKEGLKLYHALIRKYGYHRDNAKRKKEARGDGLVDLHPPPPSSVITCADSDRARVVIEDTCKALQRKLLDVASGRRKGTSFHRRDLVKILELEQKVQVPYCDVEAVFDRFLQLTPTIKRHWHENVLKRYGESDAWPEITSERVASIVDWLTKYGQSGCQA